MTPEGRNGNGDTLDTVVTGEESTRGSSVTLNKTRIGRMNPTYRILLAILGVITLGYTANSVYHTTIAEREKDQLEQLYREGNKVLLEGYSLLRESEVLKEEMGRLVTETRRYADTLPSSKLTPYKQIGEIIAFSTRISYQVGKLDTKNSVMIKKLEEIKQKSDTITITGNINVAGRDIFDHEAKAVPPGYSLYRKLLGTSNVAN